MAWTADDKKWMGLALDLAAKALGLTRPNPAVGAVVVKNGELVGKGYHKAAGQPHAEVVALRRAGRAARGAVLYVTLEPCSHYGRTPPCVDEIIRSGIARVVVPIRDPNPLVAGRGIRKLRAAGIRVDVGLMAREAARLNRPFLVFHQLGRPYFVAKWALTLDGEYRAVSGDSKWITGVRSRRYVHELRARYDAVMVGIGTVIADNPRLNVRLVRRRRVIQPARIIVDGHLRTPIRANCMDPTDAGPTILVATKSAPPERVERFRRQGATVLVAEGRKGIVDPLDMAARLRDLGIQSVLVEGGEKIFGSLFAAGLVDRVVAFFAPKIVGGGRERSAIGSWGIEKMKDALQLENVEIRLFGKDVCVEGDIPRPSGFSV